MTEQLDDNAADLRVRSRCASSRRVRPVERLRDAADTVLRADRERRSSCIVLVAFMLGQREDLRDRFIRLIGPTT